MNDVTVDIRHLRKQFGEFTAVDDLTLSVGRGEIFGFLGPNGAGKSTVIRMLCGLLTPTSGEGSVAGYDIINESEKIKEQIGYMSQRFSLYEDLTVSENIEFYAGIYGVSGHRLQERRDWILGMAGLVGREHSITGELSAGWKQRLALGTAIVHEPHILFLDEPTSGVDPLSRRQFWELIHDVAASGVTVFVTTHFMDEAEHCDRMALIYKGIMIASGTSAELKAGFRSDALYEISAQPVVKVIEALSGSACVRDVALFGNGLHLTLNESSCIDDARKVIIESGATVESIERVGPSLEDVFVSLIDNADREAI